MSLLKLPIEIITLICERLHIDHLFNFGHTCHHLRYILHNENICRRALKALSFSAEAVEAQTCHAYARGLRRLVKRRNAVRGAEPYLVAVVAMAETFIYTNGVLCYTVDRENLHVLDVHRSATEELVVKVPWMLRPVIPGFQRSDLYSFRPLYCSDGILSCLYSHRDCDGATTSWLVILRTKDVKLLALRRLHSTQKLFVRNNSAYLVYGTKSHPGFDGFKRWVLQRLDLRSVKWAASDLVLWNFAGSKLGQNICFEIFDDRFYCLSNKNKLQPEHGKWNSYYHVVRFPLSEATRESCESPPMRNLWRRHAAEGPVDQRWDSLQLARDNGSGKLFIVESRREWLPTNAQSQRSCYRKEVRFGQEDCGQARHPLSDILRDTLPIQEPSSDDEAQGPNAWDSETHVETRPPENVHVGDNGAAGTMFTIGECFVRFYNASCDAFVDLVNESQRLRLRVRPKVDGDATKPETHHGVTFWPPDQTSPPNPRLAQLHDILYPQIPLGEVEWAMDDRSLVYAPGHAAQGRPRPLVLMSFDAAIRLPAFPKLRLERADVTSPPDESHPAADRVLLSEISAGSVSTHSQAEGPPETCPQNPSNEASNVTHTGAPWAKTCRALYLRMPKTQASPCGFDLSY
ncbi:hypothetical protein AK830_g4518 [Neonectria ditissima]|uniref:F-box domain-containing protein n=1 Tax=Neonectria ditissima TaxID=78410 RepID=A0A0P7BNK8_9HYPO|nr:hypothetical protein AK830_g4518 [Neonectria ditissima]